MRTPSRSLFTLGEALGVVPIPPDEALAGMLAAWWTLPRSFGCETASRSPEWVVVPPSPAIYCPACAVVALEAERRCAYCRARVARRSRSALAFEMSLAGAPGQVKVAGWAHRSCAETARRS